MTVTLIAAMDRNYAIGADNKLLWHLPADMAYFKAMTTGKTVLMGRKTFESLGRPLPNRRNVVLTRQQGLAFEGCEIVHDIKDALERFRDEELMVIGGAEVYTLALPYADKLLLTEVEAEIEGSDAFFPKFDKSEWSLSASEFKEKNERNPYDCRFQTYLRVRK
ncbi:dihydrofolate reductase [Paenibacillus nanensis]|uniref:Dihydrofolate reductase n=1 Tax=Paenibacillus nanensis TaxID=393251 RepID=A0A3A1V1F2_9BACL|nr:dihydrofolate reductase [Paenibacillus nanensis]RIX53626.1 dihydrofolate reductase [Paenibacillus nanensis]